MASRSVSLFMLLLTGRKLGKKVKIETDITIVNLCCYEHKHDREHGDHFLPTRDYSMTKPSTTRLELLVRHDCSMICPSSKQAKYTEWQLYL